MEEYSTSTIQENNSPQLGTSSLCLAAENIIHLASVSEHTKKRVFFDIMDTEEEDTTKTPKKKKLEERGKLVHVAGGKGKMKQVKVKGPTFKVKEYAFPQTPKGSKDRYRSKIELLEKYKEGKDITMNECLKLYEDSEEILQ